MVLVSSKDQTTDSPKEYTDKQISVLRAILNNNVVSMEAVFSRIKQMEDSVRVLKFELSELISENKVLKQQLHDLRCSQKTKQYNLEDF